MKKKIIRPVAKPNGSVTILLEINGQRVIIDGTFTGEISHDSR